MEKQNKLCFVYGNHKQKKTSLTRGVFLFFITIYIKSERMNISPAELQKYTFIYLIYEKINIIK